MQFYILNLSLNKQAVSKIRPMIYPLLFYIYNNMWLQLWGNPRLLPWSIGFRASALKSVWVSHSSGEIPRVASVLLIYLLLLYEKTAKHNQKKTPGYRTINSFECNNLFFTQFYKLHDNRLWNNKLFGLLLCINLC